MQTVTEERKNDLYQGTDMRQKEELLGSRAWMEIDYGAICRNAARLAGRLSSGSKIMAVVKADAYGHGAVPTAHRLENMGIGAFAVATAAEGVELRRSGIRGDILILGYTSPREWPSVLACDLTQTLVDEPYARSLSAFGQAHAPVRTQLAVDTGMHRLGVAADRIDAVMEICTLPGLKVEGVFSHLCAADSTQPEDRAYTQEQIHRFDALRGRLEAEYRQRGLPRPCFHLQSSYGALNYPERSYDYVRLGIALYGVGSSPGGPESLRELEPALAVRSRVAMVRTLEGGQQLGYGRTYTAPDKRQIATVSIGYADGIPRVCGEGKTEVLIRGQRCPVVGRVCMDQMSVDVTEPVAAGWTVQTGDPVTLIGSDGTARIRAEEMAACCGTITNELLSRLGSRLERLVIG